MAMTGPYSPMAVANAVLEKSSSARQPISPMKLQKLVYFAHGYYLAATKVGTGAPVPLVDEFFEAWKYGPVLPSLYQEFKEFGSGPINKLALDYDIASHAYVIASTPVNDATLPGVLDFVWNFNATRTAMQLSNITHKTNGAWDRAYRDAQGLRGKDIPNDYILADFEPLVKKKAA